MSDQKGSSSTSQNQTQQSTIDPAVTAALQANLAKAQSGVGSSTYSPVSASQITGYMSPYTGSVVNATNAELNQQNQIANTNAAESATGQGAFGGDRASVLQGINNNNYGLIGAQTDANLNNQNYEQASQTAQTQNAAASEYPLLIQQLLNQTLGLNVEGANKTVTGQGTSNTNSSQMGFDLGGSSGGGGTFGGDLLSFIPGFG